MAPPVKIVRQLLNETLKSVSDFDAFCLDHFPRVYHEFADGMNRTSRTNLLLSMVDAIEIMNVLPRGNVRDRDGSYSQTDKHLNQDHVRVLLLHGVIGDLYIISRITECINEEVE